MAIFDQYYKVHWQFQNKFEFANIHVLIGTIFTKKLKTIRNKNKVEYRLRLMQSGLIQIG